MIPATTEDITVDWLNEALHANEFLKDVNIVSLQHEPIGGRGLAGSLARLAVAYDRAVGDLPKTIIAKWPPSHESGMAIDTGINYYYSWHEKEIRFYQEIAPKSPMRTPGLIYGDVDSANKRCALLMEDCSHYEKFDNTWHSKGFGLSREQVNLITLKLADFHARWWDAKELWSFPWMPKITEPLKMVGIDARRSFWEACAADEAFKSALPEGGWEAGLRINEHLPSLIWSIRSRNVTIVHGDFHSTNMLFDSDTPEDPLVVLDWLPAISPGAGDLGYLFGEGSITTELRRQIEQDVVKLYYQRLLDRDVSGYSHDECWVDYRRGLLENVLAQIAVYNRLDTNNPMVYEWMRGRLVRSFTSVLDNDATSVLY